VLRIPAIGMRSTFTPANFLHYFLLRTPLVCANFQSHDSLVAATGDLAGMIDSSVKPVRFSEYLAAVCHFEQT
jgi:hypothetical protein